MIFYDAAIDQLKKWRLVHETHETNVRFVDQLVFQDQGKEKRRAERSRSSASSAEIGAENR